MLTNEILDGKVNYTILEEDTGVSYILYFYHNEWISLKNKPFGFNFILRKFATSCQKFRDGISIFSMKRCSYCRKSVLGNSILLTCGVFLILHPSREE